jgi:glycosyltransferase involved in cell wall biosynthesis
MRSWGGAEVWILETAVALRAAGHEVCVVAQPDSALLVRCRAAGVPVAAIAIRCDGAPWTIVRLARHLRRRGVSAVVANLSKDLKAAAVAGRLAGVAVILGNWESDFPLKDKFYYRWYFGRLATGLLVASEATRRTVLRGAPWLDPQRIHLLPKGIDTERFRPGPPRTGPPVVGFLGQFIVRKGLRELMAAWSVIDAESHPRRPRLRLAGAGPLAAELKAWCAGLHHPDRVEILEFVEHPERFLAGLDVLVMPSFAEGFGLAAAEAQAAGVPVVAADASSLPEIVVDGETGLLVPPGDAEALAAALRRLLDDAAWARRLGQAGRERIIAMFPRERTLAGLLALTGAMPPLQGVPS